MSSRRSRSVPRQRTQRSSSDVEARLGTPMPFNAVDRLNSHSDRAAPGGLLRPGGPRTVPQKNYNANLLAKRPTAFPFKSSDTPSTVESRTRTSLAPNSGLHAHRLSFLDRTCTQAKDSSTQPRRAQEAGLGSFSKDRTNYFAASGQRLPASKAANKQQSYASTAQLGERASSSIRQLSAISDVRRPDEGASHAALDSQHQIQPDSDEETSIARLDRWDVSSQACDAKRRGSPASVLAKDMGCTVGKAAPTRAGIGLENLGNTCFMNSVLQCLGAIPEFAAAVVGNQIGRQGGVDVDRGSGLLPALSSLFIAMWTPGSRPAAIRTPARVLECMSRLDERWAAGDQQDAQEFLHGLLEALQLDMAANDGDLCYPRLEPRRSSLEPSDTQLTASAWRREQLLHHTAIDMLCGGMLQSTVSCLECGKRSSSFEFFLDLSLPLPHKKEPLRLQDCLDLFLTAEVLPVSEGYHCARCKMCQAVSKQLQLVRLPPLLILHIKRFSAAAPGLFALPTGLSKDSSAVMLPENGLDLSTSCSPAARLAGESLQYELVSVCHHTGRLEGGHYTATCRLDATTSGSSWIACDDTQVRAAAAPSGGSRTAYMLFYRRQSLQSQRVQN